MKIKYLLSAAAVAAVSTSASADAVLLTEGFGSVAGLSGSGWVTTNNSSPVGTTSWFQGNSGVFAAASGSADSYAAANFLSADAGGGAVSTWLISPTLSFVGWGTLSFDLRLLGDSVLALLDTVEVYYSASGASSNVGATSTSTGDFSLVSTYSSVTDTGWVSQSVGFGSGGDNSNSGRFAFRFVAADNISYANYVGIDNVKVTEAPEPASVALVALALAGAVAARRR